MGRAHECPSGLLPLGQPGASVPVGAAESDVNRTQPNGQRTVWFAGVIPSISDGERERDTGEQAAQVMTGSKEVPGFEVGRQSRRAVFLNHPEVDRIHNIRHVPIPMVLIQIVQFVVLHSRRHEES